MSLFLNEACPWCETTVTWDENQGPAQICPHCRLDVQLDGIYTAERFARVLDVLELMPYRDTLSAVAPSRKALEAASRLGVEQLEMRALLVHADVLGRQVQTAESGRIIREVHQWAVDRNDAHVIARSHKLLASFYRRIGHTANALEHAIRAVEKIPDGMMPETKADHIMTLALTLAESGAHDEAILRLREVLEICHDTQDIELLMLALNNLIYTCYEKGDAVSASALVQEIRTLSAKHQRPLGTYILDTIARVEILTGHPLEAELTMQPILTGRLKVDPCQLPENLLTVVAAQRMQGELDRAQLTLDNARQLCERQGLDGLLVKVREEQALLCAASGRYKAAYEEYRRFHAESENLRRSERESMARILQTIFEAEENRRDKERFKELSLRDPLTGLHNRRFIDARMDSLLKESETSGAPLSVLLVDLDHFKVINDTYSHEIGDRVLVQVANILTATLDVESYAGRYGGEEFIVILPGVDARHSLFYAEILRSSIRNSDWSLICDSLAVTASIGLSTANGEHADRSGLLAQADRNLYVAKRTGRDRVIGDAL